MNDDAPVIIREVLLSEIAPPGEAGWLYEDFRALHAEWVARGVARWLELLRRDGPHPVVVFGAFAGDATPRLVGAVVGVWGPLPIDRFDALFETRSAHTATSRPEGGAWHMIAVTTAPGSEVRGGGLGRLLLARALAWAQARGHDEVRTLSPALGLPELVARWPRDVVDAVRTSARADGRPALQVLRLHMGGGATLERVLVESRRDDRASGAVTLRFNYPTDPVRRQRQGLAIRAWCAARAERIARGSATAIATDLYRVDTDDDDRFILERSAGASA